MPGTEADDYEYWHRPNDPSTKTSSRKGEKEMAVIKLGEGVKPIFVFVYGTLRKGFGNHRLLESSWYLGEGRTVDHFVMFDVGFPLCRRPVDGDNPWLSAPVKGELYGVSTKTLDRLDALEGHPDFYVRRVTQIQEFSDYVTYMYHWGENFGIVEGGQIEPIDDKNYNAPVLDWTAGTKRRAVS